MALLRNIKDKQKNVFHKLIDKEFRLGNDIKMILKWFSQTYAKRKSLRLID